MANEIEEGRKKQLLRIIEERKAKAMEELAQMQGDFSTPWDQRAIGHVANLKVAEWVFAEQRAKAAGQSLQVNLGIVQLPVQIANAQEWEQFAQRTDAIEVEAKRGVFEGQVHGTRGEIGAVPEQLGEGISQATQEEGAEKTATGAGRPPAKVILSAGTGRGEQ